MTSSKLIVFCLFVALVTPSAMSEDYDGYGSESDDAYGGFSPQKSGSESEGEYGAGDGTYNRGYDTTGSGQGDGYAKGYDVAGSGQGDGYNKGYDAVGTEQGEGYNRGYDAAGSGQDDGGYTGYNTHGNGNVRGMPMQFDNLGAVGSFEMGNVDHNSGLGNLGGMDFSSLVGLGSHPRAVKVAPRNKRSIHSRVKRGGHKGVVGHVYTYVKTDLDGTWKWGARHNVGKKYAGK